MPDNPRVCARDDCPGVVFDGDACLAHLPRAELPAALDRVENRPTLDVRNTTFTADLFDSLRRALTPAGRSEPIFRAANFDGALLPDSVTFEDALFLGSTTFDRTRLHDVNVGHAEFRHAVRFHGTRFTGTARFDGVTFGSDADFTGATFTGSSTFVRSTFGGAVTLDRAEFDDADFRWAVVPAGTRFGPCRAASLGLGNLRAGGKLVVRCAVSRRFTATELQTSTPALRTGNDAPRRGGADPGGLPGPPQEPRGRQGRAGRRRLPRGGERDLLAAADAVTRVHTRRQGHRDRSTSARAAAAGPGDPVDPGPGEALRYGLTLTLGETALWLHGRDSIA
jgi:hypothetical protein